MVASCWSTGPIRIKTTLYAARCLKRAGATVSRRPGILIDRGAKVDARDAFADFTPPALGGGERDAPPDLVRLLLAGGAGPNAAGGGPVESFELEPQTRG